MNAALLLMVFMPGADAPGLVVSHGHADAAPPAIVSTGSSCSGNCGTISEPTWSPSEEPRKGLFTRFKERFKGKSKGDDCGGCEAPAPEPCTACAPAPAPVVHHTPKCDSCAPVAKAEMCGGCTACADPCSAPERESLLTRFKNKFKKKGGESCDGCEAPAPACDGCGASPAPVHGAAPIYGTAPVITPAPIYGQPIPTQGNPIHSTPLNGVPSIEPIAPPKEMPKDKIGSGSAYPNVTPVAIPKDLSGANNPFDLPRRHADQMSHSADYSTLTGQLLFVHADGGYWAVRYASIDDEDRYGGRVIIARDANMEDYREGDVVTVQGSIIRDKTSSSLTAPLYRANSVALKHRGK